MTPRWSAARLEQRPTLRQESNAPLTERSCQTSKEVTLTSLATNRRDEALKEHKGFAANRREGDRDNKTEPHNGDNKPSHNGARYNT